MAVYSYPQYEEPLRRHSSQPVRRGSFRINNRYSFNRHLFGRGKIQVQGIEDGSPRAITGGTGEFVNVRGEMTEPTDNGAIFRPEFTVTFKLLGAGGKGV